MERVGLIAEDLSDVEVLKKLAKKITGKAISSSHFVGKGCGPLKRKTPGWCKSFQLKGCTRVLLVHDLDGNDVDVLRRSLKESLANAPQAKKLVVIPTEEIEAWLLSDVAAIARALNLKKPIKVVHHPEKIASPKEFIRDSVWRVSNKTVQYVNSVHNGLIADHIDIAEIHAKCPSFRAFSAFFGVQGGKR